MAYKIVDTIAVRKAKRAHVSLLRQNLIKKTTIEKYSTGSSSPDDLKQTYPNNLDMILYKLTLLLFEYILRLITNNPQEKQHDHSTI